MRQLVAIVSLVVTVGIRPGTVLGAQAAEPTGCYRFDRPLGHSATGALERSDSSWYRLQLQPAGKVTRPALSSSSMRELYADRSAWHTRGDTLFLRVFTGLVGWDLTLLPEADRYVGSARYLTDAIAVGAGPLILPFRATREACIPSPPA